MSTKITKILPGVKKDQLFRAEIFRYFCFLIHSTIIHVLLHPRNFNSLGSGVLGSFYLDSLLIVDLVEDDDII
jgi:hypothetical protein